MAIEIFYDRVELPSETLTYDTSEFDTSDANWDSYPFPHLVRTGISAPLGVHTVTLTNADAEVTFALDFGGRLWSYRLRKSDEWIIAPPQSIQLTPGGPRGVQLAHGVELFAGTAPRLQSLSPIEHRLLEPSDDGEPASILFHELQPGLGVSTHARWTLNDAGADLELDVRTVRRGLTAGQPGDEGLIFWNRGPNGFAVSATGLWEDAGGRWTRPLPRQPRQTSSYSVRLRPFAGLGERRFFGASAALGLGSNEVQVAGLDSVGPAKLLLQLPDGQVMEAPLDIQPASTARFGLDGLPATPTHFEVRASTGETIVSNIPIAPETPGQADRLLMDAGTRHLGHLTQAKGLDSEAALAEVEDALLYAGDDALTWVQKALLETRLDQPEAAQQSELNAHFLAPMEPLLRSVALMRQTEGDLSLLSALKDHPEALVDGACQLLESGLRPEAARWLQAAISARPQPMLYLLLAWAHLEDGRTIEAAALVQQAELPLEQPLPWREIELEALTALAQKFPISPGLQGRKSLVERYRAAIART